MTKMKSKVQTRDEIEKVCLGYLEIRSGNTRIRPCCSEAARPPLSGATLILPQALVR
jgi:hypothetical protein